MNKDKFLMLLTFILLLTGCAPVSEPKKPAAEKKTSIRAAIRQQTIIQFKDPQSRSMLIPENFDSRKIKFSSREDIQRFFGKKFSYTIREVSVGKSAGEKHYQLSQTAAGIPVFAANTELRLSKDGKLLFLNCNFSSAALRIKGKARTFKTELGKKLFPGEKIKNAISVIFDPLLMDQPGAAGFSWLVYTEKAGHVIDQDKEKVVYSFPFAAFKKK